MVLVHNKYRFTNKWIEETIKFRKTMDGMNETNCRLFEIAYEKCVFVWMAVFSSRKYSICLSINPADLAGIVDFGPIFSWTKHKIAAKLSVSKHRICDAGNIQITAFGNQMFPIRAALARSFAFTLSKMRIDI